MHHVCDNATMITQAQAEDVNTEQVAKKAKKLDAVTIKNPWNLLPQESLLEYYFPKWS